MKTNNAINYSIGLVGCSCVGYLSSFGGRTISQNEQNAQKQDYLPLVTGASRNVKHSKAAAAATTTTTTTTTTNNKKNNNNLDNFKLHLVARFWIVQYVS
jgi:hypothetical protein